MGSLAAPLGAMGTPPPSGGASALVKLATLNGTGSSNTIKFLNASTPWTSYRDLIIQGSIRSLTTGQDRLVVNFNGSFSGLFTMTQNNGSGVNAFQNATFQTAGFGWIPTTSFSAAERAAFTLTCFDVNSNTLNKVAHILFGGPGTASGFMLVGDGWADSQSTAPITEVDLIMAGNFSTDSEITLYGLT